MCGGCGLHETRPCIVCEGTVNIERVKRNPNVLTCSDECSIRHEKKLKAWAQSAYRKRRRERAQRKAGTRAEGLTGQC